MLTEVTSEHRGRCGRVKYKSNLFIQDEGTRYNYKESLIKLFFLGRGHQRVRSDLFNG